jgi:acid phosphatase family membrane protein YuiD
MISFVHAFPTIIFHPVFLTVAASWFTAQLTKVVLHYARTGEFDGRLLTETGGMPSSHSAFVSSLATCLGLWAGWTSPVFMLGLGFAIITMHDAAGLRMAAGRQAALLNKMVAQLYDRRKAAELPVMKEMLGHSPVQVLSGAALGILAAFLLFPALTR